LKSASQIQANIRCWCVVDLKVPASDATWRGIAVLAQVRLVHVPHRSAIGRRGAGVNLNYLAL
jgi:hypothetical protein